MQRFVLDTSVLASYFLDYPDTDKCFKLFELAASRQIKLYAPYLIRYELISVLVKTLGSKADVLSACQVFETFIHRNLIELVDNDYVLNHGLDIAFSTSTGKQGYISPYDAYFHGLALTLGCNFLTADERHYNKTRDTIGKVLLFKELQITAS